MSGINKANPAIVTLNNSFSDGQFVILYSTTGMTQIAGMTFTISSVNSSGFTLLGLDSSGFATAATNVLAFPVSSELAVSPRFNYITKIDRGLTTTVTFSTTHDYIANQCLFLSVPKTFGMPEINGKTGEILSTGAYTVVLDIDSQNFNPFSFPASVSADIKFPLYTTQLFATVAPAGARNEYNIQTIPFHQT